MKKLPSLRQLQYLIALYDYQHFGRAASACCVTQSTLSASIIQLEETLETKVLERDHKVFLFTQLGQEIVERSRQLIEASGELVDYAKGQGNLLQGNFHIGCIPTIAPFIFSALLDEVRISYPKMSIFLREDTTDNLLRLLSEGKLDSVILALPYPLLGLSSCSVFRDPFHMVWSLQKSNKFINKDISCWPDKSIYLLNKEHCLTQQSLQTCRVRDSKKIHPFFATSLHTLVQIVDYNNGITFLPELAIKNGILSHTSLVSKRVDQPNAYREIGLAWRSTSKKESHLLFEHLLKKIFFKKV